MYEIRREADAKETLEGYTTPDGPMLQDAFLALDRGAPYEEFLPAVEALVTVPISSLLGFSGGTMGTHKTPGLGRRVGGLARACASQILEPPSKPEHKWGEALLPAHRGPEFGRALLALARSLPLEAGVLGLLPDEGQLENLRFEVVERIAKARRTGISEGATGLVWMAACASQVPPGEGVSLTVNFTDDDKEHQMAGCTWIQEPEARRLYEAKSKEALIEAARKAALRDTRVDPPAHECLPEVYSLLLAQTRQLIIDDETDLLAVEFLLGPLGLLPPEGRAEVDWIRRLEAPEVDAILKRLGVFNELSPDELFAQAGRYLYPDRGGIDEGGYAGELQGAIREWVEELFAKAAKKKEAITLVACEEWLADKKA